MTAGRINNSYGFLDALDVKSFGAIGNGVANDGPAIQRCFDEAFGPRTNPHGVAGRHRNRPVYFPPGRYAVFQQLYITGVQGGIIFGNGPNNSEIAFGLPAVSNRGNVWITEEGQPGKEITPCICMNGCSHIRMEGLSVYAGTAGPNAPVNVPGAVALWYMSTLPDMPATKPIFKNLMLYQFRIAMLIGYGSTTGTCDGGQLWNVVLTICPIAGLQIDYAPAINWQVYSGSVTSSANLTTYAPGVSHGNLGASYSVIAGSISFITCASLSRNTWDFINGGGKPMIVIGGSSECVNVAASVDKSPIYMADNSQRPAAYGEWVPPNFNVVLAEATDNGIFHINQVEANTGGANAARFANLGSSGTMINDMLAAGGWTYIYRYHGLPGSKIYQKNFWLENGPSYPLNAWEHFTGHMMEWDSKPGVLSFFPTPVPCLKGKTCVITDSTVTTPGTTITGGGANTVLAYCNGSAWKVMR